MSKSTEQLRRWDKRNTLIFWKYTTPFLFMFWLTIFGIIGSIIIA